MSQQYLVKYIEVIKLLKAIDLVFHTGWDCRVWSNFEPSYMCWTTMIFGTLIDRSLKFNIHLLSIFLAAETSCKMALKLCQNGF